MTDERALWATSYVLPATYAHDAARASRRFGLKQPASMVLIAIFVVVAVVTGLGIVSQHGRITAAVVCGLGFLLIFVILAVVEEGTRRRRIALFAKPGAVYSLTFAKETIAISTPDSSNAVNYTYYDRIAEQGDFVFLRVRGTRIRSVLPRQLFTPESLAFTRSKIEGERLG